MGYCINVTNTQFLLKAKNEESALKELKKLAKKNLKKIPGLAWVDEEKVLEAVSLEDAMKECRWDIHRDCVGADYEAIEFTGEKLGKDDIIFTVLAPYIEDDSFIEVVGEDENIWRWVFQDGELETIYPTW